MAKTILITGCSSGIGLDTARILTKRGYRVFATCRQKKDVTRLQKEGLESFQLDVASNASIKKALAEVKKRTPRLFAVFHNAGFAIPAAVEDLGRKEFQIQFENNLFGIAELNKHLLPLFRTQKQGRIILNSSVLGIVSTPYRGAYNATKFAMEAYGDNLRLETPSYITVSIVEPGPIATKFNVNAYKQFKMHVKGKKTAHKEVYDSMEKQFLSGKARMPFTLPGSAVSKKVVHALESRNPSPRYYVTFPTYLFGFFRRILSTRMLDRILRQFA